MTYTKMKHQNMRHMTRNQFRSNENSKVPMFHSHLIVCCQVYFEHHMNENAEATQGLSLVG